MIDIKEVRALTPGIASSDRIHLLASGSALMPQPVVEAVVNQTLLEARIGGYEAHKAQADMLDGVYDSVARLIGAGRHEIALLENATVAWCHAFYAVPIEKGSTILTCQAEYAANYVAMLQRAKRDDLAIKMVPNDASGQLDVDALEAMIDERTGLIAMTWIPTNGGLINPAEAVGAVAARAGVPYLLDACQAVGQMPVDVTALQCDFLSATGRKFLRGPRGTGFLFVAEKWLDSLEPAMIDFFGAPWTSRDAYTLREDARRFETWENAYALRAGLGVAADYAMSLGLEAISARAFELAARLREVLATVSGAEVLDLGTQKSAIVSFTLAGKDPNDVACALAGKGIIIGTSNPGSTRLDAEARNLETILRAAPHYYNTQEELVRLVDELQALSV